MSEEKYLKISPNNEKIGLGIYCSKCKGSPNNGICASKKKVDKKGRRCKTPEKHKFRLVFYSKSGNRVKSLDVIDDKLAANIAEQEYNYFRVHGHFIGEGKDEKIIVSKPVYLFDWIQAFIEFKVKPTKNRKPVQKETLKDYTLHLDTLVQALINSGINAKLIGVNDLNLEMTEIIFAFIKAKTEDGITQSKYWRTYKTFWNYLKKEENLVLISNPFNGWEFETKDLNNEIIYEEEFQLLINNIDILPATERLKGKVRRRNFPWLKFAFRLGLTMGIRRQEVSYVKWSGINLNRKTGELFGGIIEACDIKMTKLKKRPVYIYKSINHDLEELLIEMGYEQFKGLDKYIIDSEGEFTRDHIKNSLSNSFAYYIKPLGINRKLSFECLRKTYATFAKDAGGEEFSKLVTNHTNKEVMKHHYWNKLEAARTHEVFPRIFPKK